MATYGKHPFISGLTKVYQEGEVFDDFAYRNIRNLLVEGNAFQNVFDSYREFRERPESAEFRSDFIEQVRQRKPSWFDSHPTFAERLVAADHFPNIAEKDDSPTALELLSDLNTVEEKLTLLLTERIHQQLSQHG